MKKYTYVDIAIKAKGERIRYPQLRKGQSLMNALHDLDPDLYVKITGTDADCYYLDEK